MNSQCPECRKILSDGRNRCTCGWFVVSETQPVSAYQCQYITGIIKCKAEGTVRWATKGNHWLCSEHAFQEYKRG